MAYTTEFNRLLTSTMNRRTDEIRRIVVPGKGAPKQFSKRIRDKLRKQLLDSAVRILTRKRAKKDFQKLVRRRRLRFIKGRGFADRFEKMYSWADKHLHGPIIYAFWKGKKCLYVGKGKSHKRLRAYKKSVFLDKAAQLEVWQIKNKKSLPSAECLAMHLLDPRYNENRAAKKKWSGRCPVCRHRNDLKAELNSLLSLKG